MLNHNHIVKDYMMRSLNSVCADDNIEDVIRVMFKSASPVFPVVDHDNIFLGTIFSETILKNIIPEQFGFLESHRLLFGINHAATNLKDIKGKMVRDYMSTETVPVQETSSMDNVADIMLANKESYLYVVNAEGKLRGYISRADLLYYLLEMGD